MSWLNSPKKLFKFVFLFVLTTLGLFYLLPTNFTSNNITASDSFPDENLNVDRHQIKLNEFNTTWDIGTAKIPLNNRFTLMTFYRT